MVCLFLWMLVFHAAGAEVITEMPATGAAEPASSSDFVEEDGAQLQTGPVLMVTDYTIVEGEPVPGSSFVIEMNIANLSEHASAHNVLATLKIENVSVSLQQGATNQKYYHEILPMQTVTAQFPLEVYSYCVEENMILSMTMTCYDAAAVHYDFQTMMTPSIEVERTLRVGSLSVPQFIHRNSSMIISATLTNVEPVTLNDIRMHVGTQYGEEIVEVGQLLSGESKTINCIYRFPEQQTENVQVYFSYESLYGHKYSTEAERFEVVVYDPAVEDGFAADDTSSIRKVLDQLGQDVVVPGMDQTLPIPVAALILIGCAGYVAVLYYALRKKKR